MKKFFGVLVGLLFYSALAVLGQSKPISQLDSTTNVTNADVMPYVNQGQTKKISFGFLYNRISNRLSTVARTGSYNDLLNRPTIPSQVNSDWNSVSGVSQILNKPTNLVTTASNGVSIASNDVRLGGALRNAPTRISVPDSAGVSGLFFTNPNNINDIYFGVRGDGSGLVVSKQIFNLSNINTPTLTVGTSATIGGSTITLTSINFNANTSISSGSGLKIGNTPATTNGVTSFGTILRTVVAGADDSTVPTELAVRNAITSATLTAGNGLNITAGQVRLGGTLLTGNTDIIPVAGSAVRFRNIANTADMLNIGTATVSIGSGSFSTATGVNTNLGGTLFVNGNTTLSANLAVSGTTTLTGAITTNGGILAGSQRIQNVANPTAAQDATTKSYVDARVLPSMTNAQIIVANGTTPTAVAMSGDATIANTGALTLANTTVTAGSYGSATQVPVLTVDSKGRITAVTNTTISGGAPSGSAGGDLSGTYPNPTIANTVVTSKTLSGLSTGTNTQITSTQTILEALQNIQAQLNSKPSVVLQTSGSNNYPVPAFVANVPIFFLGSDYPQNVIAQQMRIYDRHTFTTPNPITSLTAGGITGSTVTLNWNAPTNRNADQTVTLTANVSYVIQYKANSSGVWINFGDVTTTTAQITGLASNTLYDFRVFSFYNWDLSKQLSEASAVVQATTTVGSNKNTLITAQTPVYFNYTPNSASLPSQTAITSRNIGTNATGSTSSPTTPQNYSLIFGVNATGSVDNIVTQLDNAGNNSETTLRVSAATNTSLALWIYDNAGGLIFNTDVATNVFNGTYKQVELRKTGTLFEVYVSTGSGAGVLAWSNSGFGNFPLDVSRFNLRSGTFGSNFTNMGTNAYVAFFTGTIPSRAQVDAIFTAPY